MKLFTNILLLSFLVPLLAVAQSNYKPGYVVDLKGDTLKGFIDYREWGKNPQKIAFKANTTNNTLIEQFTVHNAESFGVNGVEQYERDVVTISTDEVEMSNIRQGIDTSRVTDTVFLQIIAPGKNVTLYSYTDQLKTRYYVSYRGVKVPQELIYHVYLNPVNSSEVKTDNKFWGQLIYIAQLYQKDNSSLESKINGSSYSGSDLAEIVNIINCTNENQRGQQKLQGKRWFAGVGISDENMNFTGGQFTSSSNLSPKIDAGFDLIPNKSTQRYFLRLEASFTDASHSFSQPQNSDGFSSSVKFSYSTVALIPQIVYNFYNGNNLKVFIAAGALLDFSSYGQHQYTIYLNNAPEIEPNSSLTFMHFWAAFYGKAGLTINKHIELYADYVPTTTITDNFDPFAGKVSLYQAGINYLFGAK